MAPRHQRNLISIITIMAAYQLVLLRPRDDDLTNFDRNQTELKRIESNYMSYYGNYLILSKLSAS